MFLLIGNLVSDSSQLPIQGEEFRFGNMVFTSKIDSGNLQKVEKVNKDPSDSKFPFICGQEKRNLLSYVSSILISEYDQYCKDNFVISETLH